MSAGFMEDDAAETIVNDHGHFSAWTFIGVQHHLGCAGSILSHGFDVDLIIEFISGMSARRFRGVLHPISLDGYRLHAHPCPLTVVTDKLAFTGRDDDGLIFIGKINHGFFNHRIIA